MASAKGDAGFVEAGGKRLEVARIEGAGPVIVFLHEGLGSVSLWRDFPRAVCDATGCPGLVYSRAGYGRSDPAALPREPSFMHDEARVVLPEVLARSGVRDAIFIGHSDGASIAIVFAGDGGSARGLALMAPHVLVEDRCIAAITAARAGYREGDFRERLARHHDDVDGAFLGWADVWLDPRFRSWDLTGSLAGITAPVMVIQGEDDAYGTLAQVDAVCAGVSGPAERVVLEACGHSPHRDRRDETLAALTRFVRSLL